MMHKHLATRLNDQVRVEKRGCAISEIPILIVVKYAIIIIHNLATNYLLRVSMNIYNFLLPQALRKADNLLHRYPKYQQVKCVYPSANSSTLKIDIDRNVIHVAKLLTSLKSYCNCLTRGLVRNYYAVINGNIIETISRVRPM